MERLMPIIKEAAVSGLIAQATHRDRRFDLAGIGLVVLSGLILLLATIFSSLAGYHWLEQQYSQPVAFIAMAGILLIVSAIFLLVGLKAMNRNQRRTERHSREELSNIVDVLAADVAEEIADPVRENPKTALIAAALAGFLAGDKFH